jgi:energy-coupling factor transporter ATP-binding protein EcfA2
MNQEDYFLKPVGENTLKKNDAFVPISQTTTQQIKSKDSNFVFFFGTGGSGKSVILASLIYYMSSQSGAIRPKLNTPNSKEAETLLYDFLDNLRQGILPERSVRDKVTRLDLVFEPNNKSKKINPINLTFLETSGENHYEIRRGGNYHSSIEEYLSANIPLHFILVTGYDTAHQDDVLIVTFLNELERKGKSLKSVNAILVISKWDKSGSMGVNGVEELEHYVNEKLPMTSQRLNTYGLSMTYFTIGNVEINTNGEERLTSLNLQTAEVVTNWLYTSITGFDINYEGTFWERIFK